MAFNYRSVFARISIARQRKALAAMASAILNEMLHKKCAGGFQRLVVDSARNL